jgi:hypothetical protein
MELNRAGVPGIRHSLTATPELGDKRLIHQRLIRWIVE